MLNFIKFVLGISFLMLCSCETVKTLVPTGGSKADGTVELSFEYGIFEFPKTDLDAGLILAKTRCAAWGYENASLFGGAKRDCLNHSYDFGCTRYFVTYTYQCIG